MPLPLTLIRGSYIRLLSVEHGVGKRLGLLERERRPMGRRSLARQRNGVAGNLRPCTQLTVAQPVQVASA